MSLSGTRGGLTELEVGTLEDLADTNIQTPTSGQSLMYDATQQKWVNSSAASGGGSGTVTSAGFTGAQGVSVGGSPITTEGVVTIGLSAISPTSITTGSISASTGSFSGLVSANAGLRATTVSASGVIGGSNLSGTNTGDQTITLTGDVSGSGTGSFSTVVTRIQGTQISAGTPSAGEVFTYTSDNKWSPRAASGSSPLTTKGDIYTFSSANARLPIGSNGQILVADSTTNTGNKWQSLTGGGSLLYGNTTVPVGNTIANTTAETAFTSTYTIPANTLAVGDIIRIKLMGVYSTNVIAPTIIGKIKFGATTVSDTGSVSAVAGVTNGGWFGDGIYVVQAIGASGSLESQAYLELQSAATTGLSVNIPNIAPITIDTTTDLAVTITVQWGTASASNTITLREFVLEKLTLQAAAGTVTSVGVSGKNGISVTGSPITTSGVIDLGLGAITPTSISTGSVSASTGSFSGVVSANAGIVGTTASFSGVGTFGGVVSANAGIAGTTASFSGALAAAAAAFSGVVSANAGLSTTTLNTSGLLTGSTASFSGIVSANAGIVGTTASWSGKVSAAGGVNTTTVSATDIGLTGNINANQITVSAAQINGRATITGKVSADGGLATTTVSASGTIHGSNISGTNTGDQTISLTGAVSGSGTGTFVTTITSVSESVTVRGYRPIVTVTTAQFTLQPTDAGYTILCSSGTSMIVIIGASATNKVAVGSEIELVQMGAGGVSVSAVAGETLNSYTSLRTLQGQYAGATLKKIADNNWLLIGNIKA